MNNKPPNSLLSTENADTLIAWIFWGSIGITAVCSCVCGIGAALVAAAIMGR